MLAYIHDCEVLANMGQHFFQFALGKGEGGKGEVVPVHAIKAYRGSVGVVPLFLNLGTGWKLVVSLTPQPLSLQRKKPHYPLDRRLGVPCEDVLCKR